MNIARSLFPLRRRGIVQNIIRTHKTSTTNYESSQTEPLVKEKFDFEDVKVIERAERRKPAIPPFMKDVMVSVYNRELLAYPEILNKDETEELDQRNNTIDSIFKSADKTPEDRFDVLKRCGLFGAPLKLTDGGLAFNVTERIRYLETISSDVILSKRLSEHWVALGALLKGLPEDQLKKLLPDLMSGDNQIALCIKETVPTRVAQADFRTHAQLDKHGVWRLNGEKCCNHGSGYYLVLSKIEMDRIKAFLVHPNAEGVSYYNPYIAFRNTPAIPLDLVSEQELVSLLSLSRIDTAVLQYCVLRETIMKVVDYIRGKFISGKPLAEVATIRNKVGDALLTLYAAESMVYFTAGLLDGYHDPDADLEVSMCRTFTTRNCMDALMKLIEILGLEGVNDSWKTQIEVFRTLAVQDEIMEQINIYIAMHGIFYAGKKMSEEIKQIRNPLFHPTFILKKVFADRHQDADRPKLTLRLCEHLHPTLKPAAENLEYCVLRMRFACETLLARHGKDVGKALTELERLAEAGTEILAITSVLARASRSYCIGLRNGEVDMKLAACFVETRHQRVKKLILEIVDGEYLNLDHFRIEFGRKILDTNTTLVEGPTARVFW